MSAISQTKQGIDEKPLLLVARIVEHRIMGT